MRFVGKYRKLLVFVVGHRNGSKEYHELYERNKTYVRIGKVTMSIKLHEHCPV